MTDVERNQYLVEQEPYYCLRRWGGIALRGRLRRTHAGDAQGADWLHHNGVMSYCLTLDPEADRYVERIFGANHYTSRSGANGCLKSCRPCLPA